MVVAQDNWTTWEFDPSTTEPSTALVEALAVVRNVDPTRTRLFGEAGIHEFLDPDALDRLFDAAARDVSVSLTVADHPVRVRSSGVVMVRRE